MAVSYSVLLMAFVGATPDWICLTHTSDIADGFSDDTQNETGFRQCAVNGTQCVNFRFSAAMTTIVTQWQLVCDKRWITSAITSVQMSGLLLGAAGCGQMADWWGRRNTVFLTLLVQAVFSLVGGFAPSWEFFAVCRFFTGMASGGFIVVYFPLPMEFLSPRWRSVQSAIPTWSMGIGVLSLVAYLLHDWRWLSWCGAVFSAIFLLAYPCTPESVRWLVLHDRLQEAENIIRNIVTVNRKSMPDMEIVRQVARAEQEREQKVGRKYTYLDLLRGWALIKTTLFFNFTWFCSGLVYYILSFGVEHLSGNLYMNMFLLSAVEIPAMMVTWILNNRLGRRWTCFLFFMISCLTACAVVVITYVMEESERGTAVNVLVMICKLGVAAAWPCMQVFATESFPTVIRLSTRDFVLNTSFMVNTSKELEENDDNDWTT
nr:hypothetical protein BaRGS_010703 [Batillaria attramentaria]